MPENRPFVLSIAGFDPSGGAGILADCKTFEQHKVYGLAINTANTIQTEMSFLN
jgi:hydroxymethylpyrimidine/phosphomethylpyrimidine kinase